MRSLPLLFLFLVLAGGCARSDFSAPRQPTVTAGGTHACAVQADGELWCWGANYTGQLGDDTTTSRPEPRPVEGDWSSSDAGTGFTCAIRRDGTLWCWGTNFSSQLGDGTNAAIRALPVEVAGGGHWRQVSAGARHACGIRADHTLWCWGANENGQLGDGTTEERREPRQVDGWWDEVGTGDVHTCARSGRRIHCWGSNDMGRLGIDAPDSASLVPVRVLGDGWRSVRVGSFGACAIGDGSVLSCWGRGFGFAPVALAGDWLDASVGTLGGSYSMVCAIAAADGSIRCWNPEAPVEDLLDGTGFLSVSVGDSFGCAGKADGSSWCWGDGTWGQLGGEALAQVFSPAEVGGQWTEISAGAWHTCGIKADETLWCWGSDFGGVLGNGSDGSSTSPEMVPGGGWTSLSTRSNSFQGAHACALREDGSLWCWGSNEDGQLGLGTNESQDSPALLGTGWASVDRGARHTCATRLDGTLWCWGWNYHGQLGIGSDVSTNAPSQVAGSWETVTTGEFSTCATRTDGSLWCWGLDYFAWSPAPFAGSFSTVSAGDGPTCAVTTAQSITCWGADAYGESSHAPTAGNWLDVSAGEYHSCGVREDHTLWCWGKNDGGKLGDGTTTSTTGSPVQVPGTDWSEVSAASGNLYWGHTCATKLDGSLWCWGHNLFGELGLGTAGIQPDPVLVTGLDGGTE